MSRVSTSFQVQLELEKNGEIDDCCSEDYDNDPFYQEVTTAAVTDQEQDFDEDQDLGDGEIHERVDRVKEEIQAQQTIKATGMITIPNLRRQKILQFMDQQIFASFREYLDWKKNRAEKCQLRAHFEKLEKEYQSYGTYFPAGLYFNYELNRHTWRYMVNK